MDIEQRIAQFENMANADPDNEMAHFSLGGAYTQAGRHADAAASYIRCYEVNPDMTKAYQLAGAALVEAGEKERASEVLTTGFVEAASRGDRMPMLAMGELLETLGAPVPEVKEAQQESSAGDGDFRCIRTGRMGTQLPSAPFRGPIGAWIYENISAETWREWIGQGTKVINELRLDLSRDEDARTYDSHMHEFLGIDEALLEQLQQTAS